MNEKVYLSQEGKQKLEEKLRYLVETERPQVVERLKIAREFGDLSENAEYSAAKDELARVSGEIEQIEQQLKVAVIYSAEGGDKSAVTLGKTIKIYDHDMEEEAVYQIVGTAEADIYENKISNDSAVGRALLGKKVGETVTVEAPGGGYQITIKEIVG
ncbi:MAG: transcription elongation factor GreA [Clostridia bacterium]|nr:transcription elongation factor GreA [Clostridia bacterium]MBQ4586392.1 transcription elongation factor GreA [Clostridia bacterium]MBQ6883270.1 transcription elongation factor GreA [Clostridia bacterium]